MYKNLRTVTLMLRCFLPLAVAAQGLKGYGAKAGMNLTNIVGDDTEGISNLVGF